MADEKKAEKAEEAKAGGMSRWIVIVVILIVFIGAEIGLALYFVNKLKPEDPAIKALKEEQELDRKKREQMTSMGSILEEPVAVTVNIAGTEGERFLKASVQLEWDPSYQNLPPVLMERMPKIKNTIIDVLSTRPMAELLTTEGKKKIRDAIVADVNRLIPDKVNDKEVGKIKNCFFNEFIIQ
jgi:flagellar protein FliL